MEEEFQKLLADTISTIRKNGDLVLQQTPYRSHFLTYFLSWDKLNIDIMTGLKGSTYVPDGLLQGGIDVPSNVHDNDYTLIVVLSYVLESMFEARPYSVPHTVLSDQRALWFPFVESRYTRVEDLVQLVSPYTEMAYRDIRVGHVEEALAERGVSMMQYYDYAYRFYRLSKLLHYLTEGLLILAGCVAGTMSPTADVSTWKRCIVKQVLHGE